MGVCVLLSSGQKVGGDMALSKKLKGEKGLAFGYSGGSASSEGVWGMCISRQISKRGGHKLSASKTSIQKGLAGRLGKAR